ncbi:MAG: hypothetical protein CL434_03770 [Acidimicrobiaceae bacterium]|jgi:small ligand-binding sensory domain FIST|nr:hypothetical protein [Acidimicrobiaceae bacterium]
MPYASSLSTHNDPGVAIGETIGEILEVIGPAPDAVVVFISGGFITHAKDFLAATHQLLQPKTLVGTTAVSVIAGAREVEEQGAVAVWAGKFAGTVSTIRLEARQAPDGVIKIDELSNAEAHTLILLADPFSFPAELAVDAWSTSRPDLQIIGGLASGANTPNGNRFLLDDQIYDAGAVGLLIGGATQVEPLVSQGCRPVGLPLIVTAAEGNLIQELGGKPALRRLEEMFNGLSENERLLVNQGLHIGRVIDEHKVEFGTGDFLIRAVMGADQRTGSLAIGDNAPVGSTVQFQVRDAESADEDLRLLVEPIDSADGALLFTCNGRGSHLFEYPDHDAAIIADLVRREAVAGMFCAGEIGPVGEHSFLHGFTASAAIFRD